MAKKTSKSRRIKTKSKSKAKVGRGKASKAKMTKASNACCPVIKWKCEAVKQLLPKKDWTEGRWTGGSSGSGDWVASKTYREVTRCKVRAGTFSAKNLDPAAKDDVLAKVKDKLAAKRCMAVEASWD